MRRFLRLAGLLVVFAIPTLAVQLPPVRAALIAIVEAMRSGGALGVAIYAAVYVMGGVITAPIAVLSAMAGYAWGPARGLLVASPACVLAAVTTFLVGRFALRGWLQRRMRGDARFAAIDRAIATDAFKITLLLRLTPLVPQNFLSYGLSLTRARVRDFAAGTFVGLLPVTCLHVYVGSLVRDAAELFEGKTAPPGPVAWIAPALGLLVTVVAVVLIARAAKRALARAIATDEEVAVALPKEAG
jgi:uncharacterized membrane protein YdjX (TVP38/TMEM64 family)